MGSRRLDNRRGHGQHGASGCVAGVRRGRPCQHQELKCTGNSRQCYGTGTFLSSMSSSLRSISPPAGLPVLRYCEDECTYTSMLLPQSVRYKLGSFGAISVHQFWLRRGSPKGSVWRGHSLKRLMFPMSSGLVLSPRALLAWLSYDGIVDARCPLIVQDWRIWQQAERMNSLRSCILQYPATQTFHRGVSKHCTQDWQ